MNHDSASKLPSGRYWNEYLETLPREKLDAYHLKRLQGIVKYAYDYSPFYRRHYDQAGVKPEDIRTLDDFLEKIPAVDKPDLIAAQAVSPPYGDLISRFPDDTAKQFFMSSGSTGVPLQAPYSDYESLRCSEHVSVMCWAVGVRPGDTMYLAFNFGIFVAMWMAYRAAARMGVHVISGGGVDTKTRLKQIRDLKPTMLFATPTYALHMAEVAWEMGVDLPASSVKFIFASGEPGANIPSTRSAIEDAWGAKVYEFYGSTETGAMGQGCPVQGGMHTFEQDLHSLVLDESGRPAPEGGRGEHVVTSYLMTTQPIIKYKTHDVVEARYGTCECGRTWKYLVGGVLGRTDNMITIKGVNVFPAAVEALLGLAGGVSEHFEMHVWRESGLDQLRVRVEASKSLADSAYSVTAARAQEILRDKIRVGIPVEVLPPGSLPRYELKARRFFDHRRTGSTPPPWSGAKS
ncbi:MAG: AMP-binding protein [Dehalococcoidia bacterium]|nr:AMP-binding protein [Dehalococcoidia bacterium]